MKGLSIRYFSTSCAALLLSAMVAQAAFNPSYPATHSSTFNSSWTNGGWIIRGWYSVANGYLEASNPAMYPGFVSPTVVPMAKMTFLPGSDVAMMLGVTAYSAGFYNWSPAGTFHAVRYASNYIYVYDPSGTVLGSAYVPTLPNPSDPIEMRALAYSSGIRVWMNGNLVLDVSSSYSTYGSPGIDVASGGILSASTYANDGTAPTLGTTPSISPWALPSCISLQWQPGSDGSGIGIWKYDVYKSSGFGGYVTTNETTYADCGYFGSGTYTYQVVAYDYFGNAAYYSTISTSAPPGADPRQIGVRQTGAYWGGAGEQINMRSGNLNFTVPMATAMSRGGKSTTFALSYNSQNWRQDAAGTWKVGNTTGVGFGWQFMAGSLTPYWSNYYTTAYWVFRDATGAEYILNTGGALYSGGPWVWTTSGDGARVWYNQSTNRLYFPDGTSWIMGQLSAGFEEDSGTRYPSAIEDSNGNYIAISYNGNSSRISAIYDVRGLAYTFGYSGNYLTSLTNQFTGQTNGFGYAFASLYSPFSSPVYFGNSQTLTSISNPDGTSYSFTYDSGGAGELKKVTMPLKGEISWDYRTFTYSNSRSLREVQYRYLKTKSGGSTYTYTLTRDDSGDASRDTHIYGQVEDTTGGGRRKWTFNTSGTYFGLATKFEGLNLSGTTINQSDFTWASDSMGRPYVTATLKTLDPGQSYTKQSKVEQTLDAFGNVTQRKIYNYGNLTTAARTYNYSYLSTNTYLAVFVLNRLTSATVTGSGTTTLVTNSYDGSSLTSVSPSMWDSGYGNYGNLTASQAFGSPQQIFTYDRTGTMRTANDGQVTSTIVPTSNNAVVDTVTTGSFTLDFDWNSYLGLTQKQAPNSSTTTYTYDSQGRMSTSTSPAGATTTFDYYPTATPPYSKATTNGKWVKTYPDGFGRTIKTEMGYSTSTLVSTVESEYQSVGALPTGTAYRSSRPYAPSATVYWATSTFDALGRTTSAALPSSMGTTNYVYEGNTVKITDPAGKWKKMVTNAMGEMTQVIEPNPAGGADLTTDYTYNDAGQLTNTQQVRGSVTQNRSFTFSSTTGQMSSSTSPEKGTQNFYYNSDYSLNYKIDAKNQKIAYTYDSLKRVTQIGRYPVSSGSEDVCQRTTFNYDSNPYDGSYSSNVSGRLAAVRWGDNGATACTAQGGRWTEMYTYSSAGLTTGKRLDLYRGVNTLTVSNTQAYNNEGQLTSFTVPYGSSKSVDYDSAGRATTLRETDNSATYASGAVYNAAGQLTQFTYGPSQAWTQTNTYNILGQLTERAIPSVVDWTYNYPPTTNNGQIDKQKDVITDEEVNYTYDALKRLVTAQTTGPDWGLSFGYDGFGNKLSQTVTKGIAPSMSITVNSSNQVTGQSYDSNGNMTSGAANTLTYDVDNRILTASGTSSEWYGYTPSSNRVWKKRLVGGSTYEELIYFYAPAGGKLVTVTLTDSSGTLSAANKTRFLSFAGQLIYEGGYVVVDRLGSVKYRDGSPGTRYDYWPYGEEKPSATTQGLEKFGTYERDHTGLDYADQRFFTNGNGRFVTPDPAGSGTNWYAYVGGDPINNSDPTGLSQYAGFECNVEEYICNMIMSSIGLFGHNDYSLGPNTGCVCGNDNIAPLSVFLNDLGQSGPGTFNSIQFQSADATFGAINAGIGNGYVAPPPQPGAGCGGIALPAGSNGSCSGGSSGGTAVTSTIESTTYDTTYTLGNTCLMCAATSNLSGFTNGFAAFSPSPIGLGGATSAPQEVIGGTLIWNPSATVTGFVGRFTQEQQIIVDFAKQGARTGLSQSEAETLIEWAQEYNLRGRNVIEGPHFPRTNNPGSLIDFVHAHIGPINHIKVR